MADPLRPGVRIFATTARDVTELNRAAAAERRRRELGEFAAQLAQRALDEDLDEMFADVSSILRPFAQLLGADLAYLDLIDTAADALRPLGDWTSDRYSLPRVPPREVRLSEVAHWIAHLLGPRSSLGSTAVEVETPWDAELESVFGIDPGGSKLYAPLRLGNQLVGLLGLSSFPAQRVWTSDEIEMVQQVADTLANLLARQRSQEALRANEVHLAAMLANVNDVLVVIDRVGVIQFVNPAVQRVLGIAPDDAVGRHFLGFVHLDDHQLATENFADTVSGRSERSLSELRLAAPDGRVAWFEVETSGEFDDVLKGFVLSLRDISVRRNAVDAATRRQAFERVAFAVARWALDTEFEKPFAGLDGHLQLLGEVLRCDAVTVSLREEESITPVSSWRAPDPGSEQGLAGTLGQPVHLPSLVRRYQHLEPLVVFDIDDVAEPWADECRSGVIT